MPRTSITVDRSDNAETSQGQPWWSHLLILSDAWTKLGLLPGQLEPLANQVQCSSSSSRCSHQANQLLSAQHFSPTQTCNLATRHSAAPALRALEWWSNDLLWQCSRYRPGYSNWIQEYIWLNKWRKKIIVVALMATCYNILVYLNIIECSQHSTKWNHRRHA